MKKKVAALLLAAVMVVTAGCGAQSSSGDGTSDAAASGNTVVIAMGSGFSTLDPGHMYEQNPILVANACYETLFKVVNGSDEPQPSLAESFEVSEDKLSVTIQLKEGATFASGNPVTSADVAFSLNRTKNLKGSPSFICDTIDSIETPDDTTVILHLTEPDSGIISKLTYVACSILDSEVVKANGGTDAEDAAQTDTAQEYLNENSAGSGMYTLTSYTPDEEIVIEKNTAYYADATNVDKYVIKLQDDANTQMMGLTAGDIDIAINLTDDTIEQLDGTDVQVINTSSKTVSFVMLNSDEAIGGPVADPKVQQAIRYALDYEGIQTICGEGSVTPESIIQVGFMGSKGELDVTQAQNIDKAKELLAEAGYADGFDIDMPVCELDMEGIPLLDIAQKVKEDLSAVGINANIVQQDWAGGYGDAYRDGQLGMTVMYWGIDYYDPNVQLAFLPGQTVGLRAGWQAAGNEAITAIYTEILSASDNTQRAELLEKLQDEIAETSPFIMVAQAACHVGYNSRLDGVEFSDVYRIDVTNVNVK
ncbi:MAG: ABC transporter substrate-binding protein [Lachnospiraceae bacterium]